MGTIQQTKCKNCGAESPIVTNSSIKCSYCGSTYNVAQSPSNPSNLNDNALPSEQPSPNTSTGGIVVIVLMMILAFMIVVYILVQIDKNSSNTYVSSSTDSIAIDTSLASLNQMPGQENAKHFKRINPEPQVLIKRCKIRTTQYMTCISITFQNKTVPDDYMTYIDFSFKLFDKKGVEIKTGDSNTRGTDVHLMKGESDTAEWQLTNRLPKAKTAKVLLKKVVFGNTIWDY